MVNLLFDTNIFIYHFADDPRVRPYFDQELWQRSTLLTSVIVRLELLSLPTGAREEEPRLRSLLSYFRVVPLNEDIEEAAIFFRKRYRLKIPDAIIAGTAYTTSSILISANKKDFERLSEIQLQMV
jgi:predicted nucleic acid-binding protein